MHAILRVPRIRAWICEACCDLYWACNVWFWICCLLLFWLWIKYLTTSSLPFGMLFSSPVPRYKLLLLRKTTMPEIQISGRPRPILLPRVSPWSIEYDEYPWAMPIRAHDCAYWSLLHIWCTQLWGCSYSLVVGGTGNHHVKIATLSVLLRSTPAVPQKTGPPMLQRRTPSRM